MHHLPSTDVSAERAVGRPAAHTRRRRCSTADCKGRSWPRTWRLRPAGLRRRHPHGSRLGERLVVLEVCESAPILWSAGRWAIARPPAATPPTMAGPRARRSHTSDHGHRERRVQGRGTCPRTAALLARQYVRPRPAEADGSGGDGPDRRSRHPGGAARRPGAHEARRNGLGRADAVLPQAVSRGRLPRVRRARASSPNVGVLDADRKEVARQVWSWPRTHGACP